MMARAAEWLLTLFAVGMLGVMTWPAEQRPPFVSLTAVGIAVCALAVHSLVARAAGMTLAALTLTVLAEPALFASAAGDPRLPWTALLAALSLRFERVRSNTLIAAAVIAATISPPSDISLLRAAPPVLLQVLVCVIAIAMQLVERPDWAWWRAYRLIEPLILALAAALLVLPFGRNGLSLPMLLAWYAPPSGAALAVAAAMHVIRRTGAGARPPAPRHPSASNDAAGEPGD